MTSSQIAAVEPAICAAYAGGLSAQACAEKFGPGLNRQRVLSVVRRNGITVRPARRPPGQDPAAAEVLGAVLASGQVTVAEAAERCGVTRGRAWRVRTALPPGDWIRAGEAARLLGIKTDTLGHRALRGGLPLTVHRTPGGQRRYLRSEVVAYARSVTAGYEAAEAGQ